MDASNDTVTREQAATILARYAARCGVDTTAPLSSLSAFNDKAKISSWAQGSVAWIADAKIMTGHSSGKNAGCFAPQDPVLREQMAKMIHGVIDAIEAQG